MGVTNFEINLLDSTIKIYHPKSVLELGSQTNYTTPDQVKPPFMSDWYILERDFELYVSIDLAGDNHSVKEDLSKPVNWDIKFDLVTDFGTSEHCVSCDNYEKVSFHDGHINSVYPKGDLLIEEAYYNCWLNKHNLLANEGIMISVNPMTGNWPEHGYSYINEEFYKKIAEFTDYEIIQLGTHAAMGNTKDGWNVYCIMQKKSEVFPSFYEFNKFPIFKK
ncbi:MAG: hypothetical protein ABI091_07295 [Ferruginibacter sp.]